MSTAQTATDATLVGIPLAGDETPDDDDGDDDVSVFSMSATSEHASTSVMSSSYDKETHDSEKRKQMKIGETEERHVKVIRVVTFSFVILSAITACVIVYFFAKDYDKRDFEWNYEAHVQSIQNDVVWEVKYNFVLLQQLSSVITAELLASKQIAPFITMPNFEVTGGYVDGMGGIEAVMFVPLIAKSLREEWEEYSVENQGWLKESARLVLEHSEHLRPLEGTQKDHEHENENEGNSTFLAFEIEGLEMIQDAILDIPNKIWQWEGDEKVPLDSTTITKDQLLAPLWQTSPAHAETVNVDLMSDTRIVNLYESMLETNQTVMSDTTEIGNLFDWILDADDGHNHDDHDHEEPHAVLMEPVYATFSSDLSEPIGLVMGLTSFKDLFEDVLPPGADGIYVVLTGSSACGANLTYQINGPKAEFVGYHDMHNGMVEYEATIQMELYDTITENLCVHDLHIYPSPEFKALHQTSKAAVYTGIVALAFAVTSFCFLIYERLVTKRENTKNAALQVVASLFPSGVQDRVLKGVSDGIHGSSKQGNVIASFFPATTVLFADIAGFTAWSSTREPGQVFQLLETVYGAMDRIALRRGIFKVETVGDCYVAVCGLPEPREDHAVAMTRFARDCQLKMASLSQQLEVALGPDTADLSFRIGMHSGPVTGGVLRGQNARFQLFGDTMNQTSRMESTGLPNRIQMSTTTAKILIDSGKGKWLEKRPEKVDVKGKGLQETYWFKQSVARHISASVTSGSSADAEAVSVASADEQTAAIRQSLGKNIASRTERLITWNTEVLSRRVKSILQYRESLLDDDGIPCMHVDLSQKVTTQLHKYVHDIAFMYRDNPFHNYMHASHVTLSMEKMLSRVQKANAAVGGLSINTYANDITSDPLTQFAVVYAALIHDVDHTGVSNNQLVKEKDRVAVMYHGKSPAENHSINLAWTTLMLPEYKDLVKCLCPTASEKARLKKLVINAVLATDVFDPDLKDSRNSRWEQVFGESALKSNASGNLSNDETDNADSLKVIIVLEHLIQASDVAHTMQHWHVYIKWNERLYHEMNVAFQKGRLGKDPVEFWYEGELGFFDHYVIPLAKKLKECGVFGVSCDEFLNYAEANRNEWAIKGKEIVKEYANRLRTEEEVASSISKKMPRRMSHGAASNAAASNASVSNAAMSNAAVNNASVSNAALRNASMSNVSVSNASMSNVSVSNAAVDVV